MTKNYRWVYPAIGRAGLGNELFPLLRAMDRSSDLGLPLLPPRWAQIRIGPTLRGERDRRQYWQLFKRPSARLIALRLWATYVRRDATIFEQGMLGYFEPLTRDPRWYREQLRRAAAPGVIHDHRATPYVSVHVRLGDFARPTVGQAQLTSNNTSTPLDWYVDVVRALHVDAPTLEVIVSSDGHDDELEPLLRLPGVRRSSASNALDEIYVLADAEGIVGSRSTFTAWGAFLGNVPLLLAPGGDAYHPHSDVWEAANAAAAEPWLHRVLQRSHIEE